LKVGKGEIETARESGLVGGFNFVGDFASKDLHFTGRVDPKLDRVTSDIDDPEFDRVSYHDFFVFFAR